MAMHRKGQISERDGEEEGKWTAELELEGDDASAGPTPTLPPCPEGLLPAIAPRGHPPWPPARKEEEEGAPNRAATELEEGAAAEGSKEVAAQPAPAAGSGVA